MPKRIQRCRSKGWKMPEGAVYVGRPTKWGNPYKIGEFDSGIGRILSLQDCLSLYEINSNSRTDLLELRGKDLACWCPLDKPCHADILLRLSNDIDISAGLGSR